MRVAVVLENDFDESQVITIVDILKRHEISVDLFSQQIGFIKGKHDIEIYVDHINKESYEDYDCLMSYTKMNHTYNVVLDLNQTANAYSMAFQICLKLGKNPEYIANRLCFKEANGKGL